MSEKLILLVEDDKKVQDLNKRMLEQNGFNACAVLTLADAKAFIQRQTPNAVILDVGMPDGSGLDLLTEGKSMCGKGFEKILLKLANLHKI